MSLPLILIPVSSLPNELPWCSWITEHSVKQPPTPSPFQTNRVPLNPFPMRPQITRGVWRVESRNLWVSFSQNASGSLIDMFYAWVDRQSGWWAAHTHFPRWTSPSPLEWRRKKWRIDSSLMVYPKDRRDTREEIPELRHANWNGRWWGWDRWRGWRRDGTEWYGKDDWVVWARWSMR